MGVGNGGNSQVAELLAVLQLLAFNSIPAELLVDNRETVFKAEIPTLLVINNEPDLGRLTQSHFPGVLSEELHFEIWQFFNGLLEVVPIALEDVYQKRCRILTVDNGTVSLFLTKDLVKKILSSGIPIESMNSLFELCLRHGIELCRLVRFICRGETIILRALRELLDMAGVLSPTVLAFLMDVVALQVHRQRGDTVKEFIVGSDSIVRVLSMIPANSQKMRLCEVFFTSAANRDPIKYVFWTMEPSPELYELKDFVMSELRNPEGMDFVSLLSRTR